MASGVQIKKEKTQQQFAAAATGAAMAAKGGLGSSTTTKPPHRTKLDDRTDALDETNKHRGSGVNPPSKLTIGCKDNQQIYLKGSIVGHIYRKVDCGLQLIASVWF